MVLIPENRKTLDRWFLIAVIKPRWGNTRHMLHFLTQHGSTHCWILKFIRLKPYTLDSELCVVVALDVYLEKSRQFRGEVNNIFVSYQRPYKGVSTETISRWLKSVLSCAGTDVSQFKGHSVRSSSAALGAGAAIQTIMKAAGWSSTCTFNKFYNKNIDNSMFLRKTHVSPPPQRVPPCALLKKGKERDMTVLKRKRLLR